MEQIDDFMKRKLAGDNASAGYEFREEYWQQAEALIAADERRRKRRRLLGWLLLLPLLGGVGWGLLFLAAPRPDPLGPSKHTPADKSDAGSPVTTLTDAPAPSSSPAVKDNTRSENTGRQPIPESNQVTSGENHTVEHQSQTRPFSDPADEPGQPIRRKTTVGKGQSLSEGRPSQRVEEPTGLPAAQPDRFASPTVDQTGQDTGSKAGVDSLTKVRSVETTLPPTLIPELWPMFAPLPTRPAQLLERQPLPSPRSPVVPPPAIASSIDKAPAGMQFGFGPELGASSPLSQLKDSKLGLSAGLSFRLRWPGPLSLNAGLLWHWRRGQLPDSLQPAATQTLRYSFGYQKDSWQLKPVSTHTLEIPLYLQYRRSDWSADLGVAPGLLIAVTGDLTHRQSSSLQPAEREISQETVRLDNQYFRKAYVGFLAGVNYHPRPDLSVGLQAHYLPGDLLLAGESYEPRSQTLWASVQLRWLFIE